MSLIRAHFDGKVFVPEEPVNCPRDTPVHLLLLDDADGRRPLVDLARLAESFPGDPDWPADGAAEHDHYLYGTPKQSQWFLWTHRISWRWPCVRTGCTRRRGPALTAGRHGPCRPTVRRGMIWVA